MNSALKFCCKSFSLFVIVCALIFACTAEAQRDSENARAEALLPAPFHAVIDRLASLQELPADVWKMHVGDVAHGEDADLDVSSLAAHRHSSDKAPNDAVWFRQTIHVPRLARTAMT